MNFINLFVDYTKEFESPENFWRWAAYSIVAAALRDNVYFDHGIRKTFPNIFVVLLANSAEYRKSGPFTPALDLLQDPHISNTKIIKGRSTVQAVLEILSTDTVDKKSQKPLKGGSALLVAEELASFFVEDPQLIPMITDMYDYAETFDYALRSGAIKINKRCVTFLAASNETLLKGVYDQRAVYGGLLGRTFMVKPDERRKANSLLRVEPKSFDKTALIASLKIITSLSGPVQITEDAVKVYEDWYKKLYDGYSKNEDRTGITQRMHTGVLKLGIIIAAAQGTIEITKHTIIEAIERVIGLRSNYDTFAMTVGKSKAADIGTILLEAMWMAEGHMVSRREILMKNWTEFSDTELDELVRTLEAGGLVVTTVDGNNQSYVMTAKCLNHFEKRNIVGVEKEKEKENGNGAGI